MFCDSLLSCNLMLCFWFCLHDWLLYSSYATVFCTSGPPQDPDVIESYTLEANILVPFCSPQLQQVVVWDTVAFLSAWTWQSCHSTLISSLPVHFNWLDGLLWFVFHPVLGIAWLFPEGFQHQELSYKSLRLYFCPRSDDVNMTGRLWNCMN